MGQSNFVYLDTNILSALAKVQGKWPEIRAFLLDNNLTIAFSGINLVELSDATHLHTPISDLLLSVPSAIAKPTETILSEEISAHPQERTETLSNFSFSEAAAQGYTASDIALFFSSSGTRSARRDLNKHAMLMPRQIEELKSNFPPSQNGKYQLSQSEDFCRSIVLQWLGKVNPEFIRNLKINEFNPKTFQTIWLYAQLVFLKHYLGDRRSTKLSDFGDFHHLAIISYSSLVVTERDLSSLLNQIKKQGSSLASTNIQNIGFLRERRWI